jgi:anti-sigma factor RsiW
MKHLDFETLLLYIEGGLKDPRLAAVAGHLASCGRCYRIYRGVKALADTMGQSFETLESGSSCPDDREIGALVNDELSGEDSEKLSDHIKECAFCMERAAVYYKALALRQELVKTPEEWRKRAVHTLRDEEETREEKTSLFQQAYSFIKRITASLPPLPGYAAAAVAILLLIIWNITPQKEKVITIASSERIIAGAADIPTSFGFTGAGETRELKNMDILLRGRDVIFRWSPLKEGRGSVFTLKERNRVLFSGKIGKHSEFALKRDILYPGRLYSWLIAGKTDDGRRFEYTGDFMLVR